MQLPSDTDTPRAVRRFLHFLITTKREISDADAHEIANLWTAGHGYKLRTYDKPMFEQLFGVGHGCVIWDDLNSCTENDQMFEQRYAGSVKHVIKCS